MGQNKQVRDERMGQNKQVREPHRMGQNKKVRRPHGAERTVTSLFYRLIPSMMLSYPQMLIDCLAQISVVRMVMLTDCLVQISVVRMVMLTVCLVHH